MSNVTTYESVRIFELQTGLHTRLLVDVSARVQNGRKRYRVGTFRVYTNSEGVEKRSTYLGTRELALKAGLERAAMAFIAKEENTERASAAPATAPTES